MDLLSPVVKVIGSLLLKEYSHITGISDKLKTWAGKLPTIQAVLDSAEEKQMNGDTPTVTWFADLRVLAYDMEDLLDEFSVEAKREEPKVQTLSRSTKLLNCLIACCSRFSPNTLISDHHMANKIEEMGQRLEEIYSRMTILGLVQNLRSNSNNDRPRFETSSVREPKFVGREKQIEELLARLAGSEDSNDSVRPYTVVSIVGMGGLGKTTLAQELYDKAVFEVKAWTCVSDVFDKKAITKSILDQVAHSSSSAGKDDLNQLQNSLKDKISGKKFLIVLDDVWNNEYVELESLLKPLYSGSKGSRILLTTRDLKVAKSVDPNPMRLDLLSLEDCVSLLAYHSIGEENFKKHTLLQETANQLAEKCKGLPLSIKTVGGLLRFKTDDKTWKELLTDGIWNGEGEIPPALKLSYFHLPVHLKRCFTACAIFPKDYMFDQDEVIRLWIMHDLLQKGSDQTYNEVGIKYLSRLEAVSLLQKVRDEESYYSMHDLVNDLAKSIDDVSYFSSDEHKDGSGCRGKSLGKVRHASIVAQSHETCLSKRFDVYRSMKKLRTFSAFQISTHRHPNVYVSEYAIFDLIMNMKYLRMLSLSCFRVSEVPDQIGELELLRSVDLSYTEIRVLPESICELVELQSLLLRGCKELQELPKNIHRLTNLLHLDIRDTSCFQEMPLRIGDLTNLEILSDFDVGKEVGQDLKQLGPLKCIQRGLHIHNLQAVDDVKDATIAKLSEKKGVLDLSLDWGSSSGVSRDGDQQSKVLHHLQPPEKIACLAIHHYGAKKFPSWFGFPHLLDNVVSITLADCGSVDSLPPLGHLPSLESLNIGGLEALSSIGAEFYGTKRPFFRSLKSLGFAYLKAWEKWLFHGEDENDQPFPHLRQLTVKECPKLNGGCSLNLPSLVQIDISNCNGGFLKCLVGLTSMTTMEISDILQQVHFEGSLSTSWVVLEEMTIAECPLFKSFVDGDGREQVPPKLKKLEIRGCGDLEKLPDDLSGLTSLKEMSIYGCEKLSFFPSEGLPPALRTLVLSRCPSLPQSLSELPDSPEELSLDYLEGLVSIRDIAAEGSPISPSVRELNIVDCERLTTLPDSLQHLSALSKLKIRNCPALEMECFPDLPCNLSSFELTNCPKVKCLPLDMHHLTSLKSLSIAGCEGITSFPHLPYNLSSFELQICPKVKCLPHDMNHLTSLKSLSIFDCEGITSFPDLPCNLSSFGLTSCPKVKCLPHDMHQLTSLMKINIYYCEGITTIPHLPCNLSVLKLGNCPKVMSLPHDMQHLTSLKEISIENCKGITSLTSGGLPLNIESLSICNCPKLNGEWGLKDLTSLRLLSIEGCPMLNQPIGEWGLRDLTSLRELNIGDCMECVVEIELFLRPSEADWSRLLPSSLVDLRIVGMTKLERMGGGLRHHLTSLQYLEISYCPRLMWLPDDGFPDSLESLFIRECSPLLKEKCRKGKGEYWPHLRLIPYILISDF